jgi:hypothetical protein
VTPVAGTGEASGATLARKNYSHTEREIPHAVAFGRVLLARVERRRLSAIVATAYGTRWPVCVAVRAQRDAHRYSPFQRSRAAIAVRTEPGLLFARHFAKQGNSSMRKTIFAVAAALALCSSIASARDIEFSVVNKTGGTMKALYGGPSSSGDWGSNILQGSIPTGGTLSVTIAGTSTCKYDFRYEVAGHEPLEEYAVDICAIDGQEFVIE